MKKYKYILLIFLCPIVLLANAGSPMMWFGMFHLLILNLVIGVSESLYLKQRGISNRMWLIIIANYVSMIIGLFFIAPYFSSLSGNLDFWGGQTTGGEYVLSGFIVGMITSFLATLLIEFPFYYFSLKAKYEKTNIVKKYIEANLITNVIMFIFYFLINVGNSI